MKWVEFRHMGFLEYSFSNSFLTLHLLMILVLVFVVTMILVLVSVVTTMHVLCSHRITGTSTILM